MGGRTDLLTPTLARHRPRDRTQPLPWRLQSQVYVAFLGGPVAVTIIAAMNATRLRAGRPTVAGIVLAGMAGTAAGLAVAGHAPSLVIRVAGVLTYGALYLLQRAPDRVHAAYAPHEDPDDAYASLWLPGIGAIVAGWVAEIRLLELVGAA